jgi:hypothetical protein
MEIALVIAKMVLAVAVGGVIGWMLAVWLAPRGRRVKLDDVVYSNERAGRVTVTPAQVETDDPYHADVVAAAFNGGGVIFGDVDDDGKLTMYDAEGFEVAPDGKRVEGGKRR